MRTRYPAVAHRRDDVLLGVAVIVSVVLAHQLRGWPALVLAILAAGGAFGLLAGAAFDATTVPVAPAHRRVTGARPPGGVSETAGGRGRRNAMAGTFGGLLLGSVSQQSAHHASCPLVIVPDPHG